MINGLTRWGAHVVHKGNAIVHVSGHASAGELLYCYNIVKPSNVMPVHGELRHLRANAALARATGRRRRTASCSPRTASWSTSSTAGRAVAGTVDCGYVYVDGSSVGDITESALKDRRILGDEGFISVFVVIDSSTGKVVGGPEIHARGFAEDDSVFDGGRAAGRAGARGRGAPTARTTPHQLQQVIRRTVGRWVTDAHRRRPMIIPVVLEA